MVQAATMVRWLHDLQWFVATNPAWEQLARCETSSITMAQVVTLRVLSFVRWSALLLWGCWWAGGGGRAVAMVASVEEMPRSESSYAARIDIPILSGRVYLR